MIGFHDAVLQPVAKGGAVIYVLPESMPARDWFGFGKSRVNVAAAVEHQSPDSPAAPITFSATWCRQAAVFALVHMPAPARPPRVARAPIVAPSLEHRGCTMERSHELRFSCLFDPGRGFSFPCDADGRIRLEGLSESARASYRGMQGRVGRELAAPVVIDVLVGGTRAAAA